MRDKFHDLWRQMINRCHNPKHKSFKNYGARGISVSEEWRDFSKFSRDMRPEYDLLTLENRVVLDRKNNSKGYSKANCRWTSISENNFNKRPPAQSSLPRGVRKGGKRSNKFRSCINFNRKRIHIGMFDTVEEAKEAYQKKALELYGYIPNS